MIAKDTTDFSSHFFLGEMLHLSGFIPLDKFPSIEAHDSSVFQIYINRTAKHILM